MRRGGGRRERDQEEDEERRPDFPRAFEGRELGDRDEQEQMGHGP